MKFNGVEYYEGMGDAKRFPVATLRRGQVIKVLFDDETPPLPGSRRMKRGEYIVLSIVSGLMGGLSYRLAKNTKSSKYVHVYNTIAIDKAILGGAILL